jgi:hypothetical protein
MLRAPIGAAKITSITPGKPQLLPHSAINNFHGIFSYSNLTFLMRKCVIKLEV